MAIISTFKCDQCGKTKGEANHWFLWLRAVDGAIHFRHWADEYADELGHLCSPACSINMLSGFLEAQR